MANNNNNGINTDIYGIVQLLASIENILANQSSTSRISNPFMNSLRDNSAVNPANANALSKSEIRDFITEFKTVIRGAGLGTKEFTAAVNSLQKHILSLQSQNKQISMDFLERAIMGSLSKWHNMSARSANPILNYGSKAAQGNMTAEQIKALLDSSLTSTTNNLMTKFVQFMTSKEKRDDVKRKAWGEQLAEDLGKNKYVGGALMDLIKLGALLTGTFTSQNFGTIGKVIAVMLLGAAPTIFSYVMKGFTGLIGGLFKGVTTGIVSGVGAVVRTTGGLIVRTINFATAKLVQALGYMTAAQNIPLPEKGRRLGRGAGRTGQAVKAARTAAWIAPEAMAYGVTVPSDAAPWLTSSTASQASQAAKSVGLLEKMTGWFASSSLGKALAGFGNTGLGKVLGKFGGPGLGALFSVGGAIEGFSGEGAASKLAGALDAGATLSYGTALAAGAAAPATMCTSAGIAAGAAGLGFALNIASSAVRIFSKQIDDLASKVGSFFSNLWNWITGKKGGRFGETRLNGAKKEGNLASKIDKPEDLDRANDIYSSKGGKTSAELLKGLYKLDRKHIDAKKMTSEDWERADSLEPKYGKMGEIVNLGQMTQRRAAEVIEADLKEKGDKSFYEKIPTSSGRVAMGAFRTDVKATDNSGIYLSRGTEAQFESLMNLLARQGFDTKNVKITGGIGSLGREGLALPHTYTSSETSHYGSNAGTIDITNIIDPSTGKPITAKKLEQMFPGLHAIQEGNHIHLSFRHKGWQVGADALPSKPVEEQTRTTEYSSTPTSLEFSNPIDIDEPNWSGGESLRAKELREKEEREKREKETSVLDAVNKGIEKTEEPPVKVQDVQFMSNNLNSMSAGLVTGNKQVSDILLSTYRLSVFGADLA